MTAQPAWRAVVSTRDGVIRMVLDARTGALLDGDPLRTDQVRPAYPTNYLVSDAHSSMPAEEATLGPHRLAMHITASAISHSLCPLGKSDLRVTRDDRDPDRAMR